MSGYWQRRSLEKIQQIESEMAHQTMADVKERNQTRSRRLALASVLLVALVVIAAQQIVTGNIDLLGEQLPYDVKLTLAGVDESGHLRIVMEMDQAGPDIIFDDVYAEIHELDSDRVAASEVMPVRLKSGVTQLRVGTEKFSLKSGSCNLSIRFKGVFKETPEIPIRHLEKL